MSKGTSSIMNPKIFDIIKALDSLFPDAHCELNYQNDFELLCAVMLSAQTTDERVNLVTPLLFQAYPDAKALARAELADVERIIHSIGLYHNKALNLIEMARVLSEKYDGRVPDKKRELVQLPGVGNKTANVVLSEYYDQAYFAVDTHVSRIAKRLGLAKSQDDVSKIEEKLKRKFPKQRYKKTHHQMIFMGRYMCKAKRPLCEKCPFELKKYCRFNAYGKDV